MALPDLATADLSGLTIAELITLDAACRQGSDALLGIYNQPRATKPVRDLLEEEIDHLNRAQDRIHDEIAGRDPDSSNAGREDRLSYLARWAVRTGAYGEAPQLVAALMAHDQAAGSASALYRRLNVR